MKSLTLLIALLTLVSCGPKGDSANVELIQDMMEQEAIKPQEFDPFFKGGISALVPPENTQPVGFVPYKYGMNVEQAARENKNPLSGQMSEEVLLAGQKYFETNCAVCHGYKGHGDGPVSTKYPLKIPSLVSDKIKSWSDGNVYHVITMGQGTMGPYASHIPQKYRWQVVNYIRHLQKTDQ